LVRPALTEGAHEQSADTAAGPAGRNGGRDGQGERATRRRDRDNRGQAAE
jgi:hypothetical protein